MDEAFAVGSISWVNNKQIQNTYKKARNNVLVYFSTSAYYTEITIGSTRVKLGINLLNAWLEIFYMF